MAERFTISDELNRLLNALCNGELTADDAARLNTLLTTDEQARECYNNYMFLHAGLHAQHASLEAVEAGRDFGLRISDCGLTAADSEANPQSEIRNPKWNRWLRVAAALIGVAAFSSWGTYALVGGAKPQFVAASGASAIGKSSNTIAKITATRNCLWHRAGDGIGFGSRLHAGQRLELAAGLVEITF